MINPTRQCSVRLTAAADFSWRHLKEKVEVGPLKSNISHFKPYSLADLQNRLQHPLLRSFPTASHLLFRKFYNPSTCIFCTPGCTLPDFIARGAARFERFLFIEYQIL